MKKVTLKFWCNAGHTEEQVTIEIYKDCGKTELNINREPAILPMCCYAFGLSHKL